MKQDIIKLETGTIIVNTYTVADDKKTPRPRKAVIDDLFFKANLDQDIIWIAGVTPIEGKTIADVLDEYTETNGKTGFIFLRAGELVRLDNTSKSLDDLNYAIESTIGYALEAYFYKILFSRKMIRSYSLRDVCVYSNDTTEDWIRNNMGEDGIIKSVMASGKIG